MFPCIFFLAESSMFLFLGSFLAYLSAIFIFTFLLHSKIYMFEKLERMSEFAVVAYFEVFYILLTVHLGTILANNQLDALSLMYLFILPLYKFRASQCSSSGDRLY